MDLSPEVRMQIFAHVFREVRGEIGLELGSDYPGSQPHPLHLWEYPLTTAEAEAEETRRWSSYEYEIYHPLCSTSRQIRQESIEGFQIKLTIWRRKWIKDIKDDYRYLLSDWVRHCIRELHLCSTNSLQGDFINRQQFPRLNLVVVKALVMECMPENTNLFTITELIRVEPRLDRSVRYRLEQNDTAVDVRSGKRDKILVAMAKDMASKYTLVNVPSLSVRRYEIHLDARIVVRSFEYYRYGTAGKVVDEFVSTHPLRTFTPTDSQVLIRVKRMLFNYDTEEVINKQDFSITGLA